MRRLAVLGVLLLTLLGCASPTATPVVREVRIGEVPWQVFEAPPDGMRGQLGFGEADGMLFDMGGVTDPNAVVFVMDNVGIPLDIAWFDADGRLLGVAEMPRCGDAACPRFRAPGPFRWAVEAPPGAFDALPEDARLDVPD